MSKERIDEYTGKPISTIDFYEHEETEDTCDECGTPLITRCCMCGAPVCCPKCCGEDWNRRNNEL